MTSWVPHTSDRVPGWKGKKRQDNLTGNSMAGEHQQMPQLHFPSKRQKCESTLGTLIHDCSSRNPVRRNTAPMAYSVRTILYGRS
ncbi:hypothetical protein AV530_010519 [Patagioenas fasciata monilis]|uniref:Uncharacterized protein n=1 Tax=Patagioenas fasciata monilis TaxID=372326 RepID=A0A1V4KF89_PATFA|nr:hypothetical protein AV530_010519 [Patagioenas fasciata monilis]